MDTLTVEPSSSSSSGDDEEEEDRVNDEETPPRVVKAVNPFAALLGSDDEDDAEEEEEEEEEEEPEPVPEPMPTSSGKKKKTKRGGKGRNKANGAADADLEALVKEVTGMDVSKVHDDHDGSNKERIASGTKAAMSVLRVDLRKMKAEDELKRIFGGRVIQQVEAEEMGKIVGGRSAAFKAKLQKKTTFATYKDQWSTYRSEGLYMENNGVVDSKSGMCEFAFAWKDDYAQATFDFEIAVASHDPNRLFHLLHRYPWHLETLLRIAELYHYNGQAQESAEILERCLYACERAWHPHFASAASNGLAKLDSNLEQNKPMFEALFRHVVALTRRGCHKTALECSKLLLGFDHADPMGVLCCIDYFALRCQEEKWLLEFAGSFGDCKFVDGVWKSCGSLLNFPGFAYSTAMALYSTADDIATADSALLKAMLAHPYAWTATLWKLEAAVSNDKDWQEILSHPHFDFSNCALESRSLEHLSEIFATRHHLLWRPDQILDWTKRIARIACQLIESQEPSDSLDGLTAADYVVLSREVWPATEENDFSHIQQDDFTDVVKRQLPEDDPLNQRNQNANQPEFIEHDDDAY